MANREVIVDVTINADIQPSIQGLKELKKQLRNAAAGSSEFNQLTEQIRDMEDALQGARQSADDFGGFLESAPGPLGVLGRGIKSVEIAFSSFNGALKASIIGILVAAIGGLVAAFSKSEVAMKKLQPIFIAFEKILGGIFRAFEPVLDVFIELAMQVLPYVTKGIGIFYSALFGLFTYIKEAGTGVAKIWKGIFTLDYDSVKEGVLQVANSFSKAADAGVKAYERFEMGSNELTKTEKENEEERRKNADEARTKREKAAAEELTKRKATLDAQIQLEIDKENTSKEKLTALLKQRYEAELQGQKLSDAQKQVLRDANTKKIEESLKADADVRQKAFDDDLKKLQDANKAEQDQLNANLAQVKVIYGENSTEARKVQDEIFNSQANALLKEKELLQQKQDLTETEKARIKSIGIEEQNLTTTKEVENQKRIKSDVDTFLKLQEETKKANQMAYEERMSFAQGDFELQQSILDAKIEQDKLYYEKVLANENLTAEQRKAIQDAQTANTKANATAQIDIETKKFQAQQALLGATANAVNALADIVGKNTVAGKALAVAASLINTYAAIAGQLRAATASPGAAIPGYAIAQAIATGLVGFKAVADIVKTQVPQGGGSSGGSTTQQQPRQLASGGMVSGPGTGTSDSIPAMLSNGESVINARSTSMFKPLLSTINRIGGGRQFAEGGIATTSSSMNDLNNALAMSQQPIKTYVVAQDMSSMQQFDRAQKSRSTL
jgi:chemotaxis protein histidine kinase CheA